ncbi:MAG: prolyl oligopeptidase family serine peptidase [Planctomycetes bacterium]|nr:prolyl oligopeptidase family serine peptidase [Planctomycetota bacterium]
MPFDHRRFRSFAWVVIALCCMPGAWSETSPSDFLRATFSASGMQTLGYRLLVPLNYDPAVKYPLITFLHGSGEAGTDNSAQLNNNANGAMLLVSSANRAAFPCFMLAPQAPTTSWRTADLDSVIAIIAQLSAAYSIDRERLYITGLSAGGFGTYNIVAAHAGEFAAAVPMSGQGGGGYARVIDVPFWIWHGVKDTAVSIAGDDATVVAMRAAGCHVIYTRFEAGDHLIWQTAYATPALLPWMMAQRRNQPVAGVPILRIATPAAPVAAAGAFLNLDGTCTYPAGSAITAVAWTSDGATLNATTGTASWSVVNAAVPAGLSRFAVIATSQVGPSQPGGAATVDDSSRQGPTTVNDTVAVARGSSDTTAPTLVFTSPTSSTTVSGQTVDLAGNAADNASGVQQVTWADDRGGQGTAQGTTSWSISQIALAPGANAITVTVRDGANNLARQTITITAPGSAGGDATPPVIAITSPGPSSSTASATAALVGNASDASGIARITWADSHGDSGTASGTTSWSIGSVPLTVGANAITVTATDGAGNTATATVSITRTTTVDTTAPNIVITSPSTSSLTTSATSAALVGTATDAGGITKVTWVNSLGGGGTASGTTAWSIASVPLAIGTNVITAIATDGAGNTAGAVVNITRTGSADTTPPALAIVTPSGSGSATSTATTAALAGTASDASGIARVTWADTHGGTGTASGTTSWSIASVPLTVGANAFTVTATDGAGNTTSAAITITRTTTTDTMGPNIIITSPAASSVTVSATTIAVSGTASDVSGIAKVTWVDNQGHSGTASGTTAWSISAVPLAVGTAVITAIATDGAGNTAAAVVTVTRTGGVDTTAPNIVITSPSTSTMTTSATSLALAGTVSDASGVSKVTWVDNHGGGGLANGTTSWNVPSIPLAIGTTVITAIATDGAGNTAGAVVTVTRTAALLSAAVTTTADGAAAGHAAPAGSSGGCGLGSGIAGLAGGMLLLVRMALLGLARPRLRRR